MEDYKLRDLRASHTLGWSYAWTKSKMFIMTAFPSLAWNCEVKFICSRIKKRREPRVKNVTLKLCRDRKSRYNLYEKFPTCAA